MATWGVLPLLSAAWAFEIAERATWTLPAAGATVGVVDGQVFVGGATGLWRYDTDGTLLAGVDVAVDALLVRDVDADGVLEVWTCGPDGLAVTTWSDTPGTPTTWSTTPCLALAETADGIATADNSGVTLWTDDGAGGLLGPEDAGVTLTGAPLLAVAGEEVAAATVGDTVLQVVGSLGVSNQAAGGPVADLLGGEAWTWLVTDPPGVARVSGFVADLPAEPARLAIGEVDGDLLDDFVVVLADGGLAVARGTGDGATFPGEGDAVALLELTGDGCADVLVLDGDQLHVLAVTGCAGHLDGDADGWTPDAGDCDDADATVSPGAGDACNGADDDCDGDVDEWDGDLALEVSGAPLEGATFEVTPVADGCIPEDTTFDWTVTATFATACDEDGRALSCLAADDGTAHVLGWVEATPEIAAEADVVVGNVAPELIVPGGCGGSVAGGSVGVTVGEVYYEQLLAEDPGDDVVTFRLLEAPWGMSVEEDGALTYRVMDDTGAHEATLEVADEDGGATTVDVTVHVHGEDDGWSWWSDDTGGSASGGGCEEDEDQAASGCGCCGSSSFVFVLFPLVGWWRRRDQPDRNRA